MHAPIVYNGRLYNFILCNIVVTCDHHLAQFWVPASSPLARRKLIMPSTPPNITEPSASNDMAVLICRAQSLPQMAHHTTSRSNSGAMQTPAQNR